MSYSADIRPRCMETGKVSWESKKVAKIQAKNYRKKHGSKMGVYQCEECRGWHIGHRLYHKRAVKSNCKPRNRQVSWQADYNGLEVYQ